MKNFGFSNFHIKLIHSLEFLFSIVNKNFKIIVFICLSSFIFCCFVLFIIFLRTICDQIIWAICCDYSTIKIRTEMFSCIFFNIDFLNSFSFTHIIEKCFFLCIFLVFFLVLISKKCFCGKINYHLIRRINYTYLNKLPAS